MSNARRVLVATAIFVFFRDDTFRQKELRRHRQPVSTASVFPATVLPREVAAQLTKFYGQAHPCAEAGTPKNPGRLGPYQFPACGHSHADPASVRLRLIKRQTHLEAGPHAHRTSTRRNPECLLTMR